MTTLQTPSDADIALQRLTARLRFRHLTLLLSCERHGSLRGAAQVLNLTQPALSKALGEVESAFGSRLFTRTARGLTPTRAGLAALRGARALLDDLGQTQRDVQGGDPASVLRVGAPPFVALHVLPPVLTRLLHGPSALRVVLTEERVPVLLQALAAGDLDTLVSNHPAQMPEDLGVSLRLQALFDTRFVVIAPPGFFPSHAAPLPWLALAERPCVMPARSSMVRRALEDAFLRAGLSPPEPVIESNSPVTNVELVAAGAGWAVVPEQTARDAVAMQRVLQMRTRPALRMNPVALITRATGTPVRVQVLLEALLAQGKGPHRPPPAV